MEFDVDAAGIYFHFLQTEVIVFNSIQCFKNLVNGVIIFQTMSKLFAQDRFARALARQQSFVETNGSSRRRLVRHVTA